jgi:hypothetical protein
VTQASKNRQPETEKGDTYEVACLLARYWHEFFLEWKLDGSRGLVKSSDILDKAMIEDFIKKYSGFDEGFDLIQERLCKGGAKYLLHARGHSSKEDLQQRYNRCTTLFKQIARGPGSYLPVPPLESFACSNALDLDQKQPGPPRKQR